jgi:hypothetical protein
LFTGRVEKIVLRPSGAPGCPPPCAPDVKNANGTTKVCVSNAGGCQSTEITVEDTFLGETRPGSTITLESRTGEWGGTTFPQSCALILVHLDDKASRWTETATRDGRLIFKPARLFKVGGFPVASLPVQEDGWVSLDQLLAHINASQATR